MRDPVVISADQAGGTRSDRAARPERRIAGAALTVAALGVVFGDIGTSPLYSFQTVFALDGGIVKPTPADVYGIVSLVFWSISIIVSVKYVSFVMRADNEGEGGIMALVALVRRVWGGRPQHSLALALFGVFGASLFYGDSVITPSISVLSAVEGVKVAAPSLSHLVLPAAVAILTALFAVQRLGTARVGGAFGPVMLVWFGTLLALGVNETVRDPGILRGLSPTYAAAFLADDPYIAFVALGAVVLALTGAEALYADMGHFGRPPIARAWFFIVLPALTLNYLGQGALILRDPSSTTNPFFLLVPDWGQIPMVFLATVATVIASQSVISGAFSVSRQAAQLGFVPRLNVRHTSRTEGQVYVPSINWTLFVAVIVLVLGFRTSARLASAYGVAVTGTFVINTVLFLIVARLMWRWAWWKVGTGCLAFLSLELAFFAANLTKVHHGGWVSLLIAVAVFTVMTTWQRGREIVTTNRIDKEGPLRTFVDQLHHGRPPVLRIAGTAVFPHPSKETAPLAMRATVEHTHVLHQHVIIVTVETANRPYVGDDERFDVDDLGYVDDGIVHLHVRTGFQETPDIPRALAQARELRLSEMLDIDLEQASYFLSQIRIRCTDAPGMKRWRKRLFIAVAHHAASPIEVFRLPDERTLTVGSLVDV
jgi:KUP system potassium uptake protein